MLSWSWCTVEYLCHTISSTLLDVEVQDSMNKSDFYLVLDFDRLSPQHRMAKKHKNLWNSYDLVKWNQKSMTVMPAYCASPYCIFADLTDVFGCDSIHMHHRWGHISFDHIGHIAFTKDSTIIELNRE